MRHSRARSGNEIKVEEKYTLEFLYIQCKNRRSDLYYIGPVDSRSGALHPHLLTARLFPAYAPARPPRVTRRCVKVAVCDGLIRAEIVVSTRRKICRKFSMLILFPLRI